MRGSKRKWLMVVFVLSLTLGSVSVAWAQGTAPTTRGQRRRPILHGEVAAVDGATLSLETPKGEVKILTDDGTRFRAPHITEPGLDDVQVGDRIAARGRWEEIGTLRAQDLLLIPANGVALRGTVADVTERTFTVTTREGAVAVQTDDETRLFVPGVQAPSLEDLKVEASVAVAGLKDEAGNVIAKVIKVQRKRRPALARGEVTSLASDGFSLDTRRGPLTVQVNERTRYRIPGVEEAGLEDLSVGAPVLVGGVKREGRLIARIVGMLPRRGRRDAVRGEVIATEAEAIRLVTPKGEVTVLTDARTRFILPGVQDPGLEDLEVGQTIGAAGRWKAEGQLQARIVGARPDRDAPPPEGTTHP